MKTFKFKQHNQQKAIPFAIIYLIIAFTLFYFICGGIIGMANQVNKIGSAKAAGIIVAILVLGPFFILLQLLHHKIEVDIDSLKLFVKKNNKECNVINLDTIDKLELNKTKVNRLDVYDRQNNLLIYFHPVNAPDVLNQIIKEIASSGNFVRTTGTQSYFSTKIETFTYKRITN